MRKYHFLIIGIAILILSCDSVTNNTAKGNSNLNDEVFAPERMDAVLEQVDFVAALMEDDTSSNDSICKYLIPLVDTLDLAICNSSDFEFTLALRGFARMVLPELFRREVTLPDDYMMKLVALPFKWAVFESDSSCVAITTMFRSSHERWDRFANLVLTATDNQRVAMLVATNFIDMDMNNVKLSFVDNVGKVSFQLTPDDGRIDSSVVDSGVIRVIYPLGLILPHLTQDAVMELTYDTPKEQVLMKHVLSLPESPKFSPAEQIKVLSRFVDR